MNELRLTDPFDLDPFEGALREFMRPWRAEGVERAPQIRIDLKETDTAYTVKAEIPGVRKDDIDVRIDGGQVTIAAEVKEDKEETKNGRVLRSERRYGFASRSFRLAADVDADKADAKYTNGVLELVLPKKSGPATRRLNVG